MSILGFDSPGRFALGQISQAASGSPTQAVGVGVARALGASTQLALIGVSGTGVAHSTVSMINPVGVAGIGIAQSISSTISSNVAVTGVAGIGIAQSMSIVIGFGIIGVSGTGTARSTLSVINLGILGAAGIGLAGSATANDMASLTGVSGTGTARTVSGVIDATIGLVGVAGIGIAQSGNAAVTNSLAGVAALGTTGGFAGPPQPSLQPFGGYDGIMTARYAIGQITQARAPDGVTVSVVLESARGIGVAGRIMPVTSGGGGSDASTEHRPKRKTGFEPVKKLPPRSIEIVEPSIPLPPPSLVRSTPTVTDAPPLELVDRDLIPRDLLALQAQIHAAEDATDLQDVLDILEMIDSGQPEI